MTSAPGSAPSKFGVDLIRSLGSPYFRLLHRYESLGEEHFPEGGPVIVISNHPTFWDPVLVGLGTKRAISWLAWDELLTWPGGFLIPYLGAIPVATEAPGASSLRACYAVLKREAPLGMFFEGGRSSGPQLDPPHPGAAMIALRTGTPVLPVSVSGAWRCWPKTRALPRLGRIVVTYHPLIRVAQLRRRDRNVEEALTHAVAGCIREALPPDGRALNPRGWRRRGKQAAPRGAWSP